MYPTLHDAVKPSATDMPSLSVECDDSGDVVLTRSGLPAGTGSVRLSVTLIGRDVAIEEQILPAEDRLDSTEAQAVVKMDFFGRERYHMSYSSPSQSLFAAMDFTVRPGMRAVKPFTLS